MKKVVIVLWKGGRWDYREIETETSLHEDRPTKATFSVEGANNNVVDRSFTLSGISGSHWVYAQD